MDLLPLRIEVCNANRMLPALGLVTMHSGNVSGVDPVTGHLVIKPSGIDYDSLTPDMLVEVDVPTGGIVSGQLLPSVDLRHHLFLYRQIPELRGIVHTHSNFATAFAAVHTPVPLCLTAIADEFGGEIPCAPYVDNQGDHIGQAILDYRTQAPAILLGNHGVFAWGPSPTAALKAAAMTEDVAKTVHLAIQLGPLCMISREEAAKWYTRYHTTYGQENPSGGPSAAVSQPGTIRDSATSVSSNLGHKEAA
jgi:L-ribulose-5-phosphate 4-epimerase